MILYKKTIYGTIPVNWELKKCKIPNILPIKILFNRGICEEFNKEYLNDFVNWIKEVFPRWRFVMGKYGIPNPPINIQKEYVKNIKIFDDEIEKIKEKITLLKLLKRKVLKKMFKNKKSIELEKLLDKNKPYERVPRCIKKGDLIFKRFGRNNLFIYKENGKDLLKFPYVKFNFTGSEEQKQCFVFILKNIQEKERFIYISLREIMQLKIPNIADKKLAKYNNLLKTINEEMGLLEKRIELLKQYKNALFENYFFKRNLYDI